MYIWNLVMRAASATFGASFVKSRRTPLPIAWKCTGNPEAATASHIGFYQGSHNGVMSPRHPRADWRIPILHRFGAVSVRMYADDHQPPYFHMVAPDFQVLVRISDLTAIAGEACLAQIAEMIAWAREHRESLALKWAELNERG